MKNDKHVALFVVSENIDWAKTQKNKSVYFFFYTKEISFLDTVLGKLG